MNEGVNTQKKQHLMISVGYSFYEVPYLPMAPQAHHSPFIIHS